MGSRHLIISGTGRAGTTFLVQLLTELGVDTGYAGREAGMFDIANAGMEWDFRQPHLPYVLKSPWFPDVLEQLVARWDLRIDHALVPIRDLFAAAESRRDVERRTAAADVDNAVELLGRPIVPGGCVPTRPGEDQEAALSRRLQQLLLVLARLEIPMTLLEFPRIVQDSAYLHRQLVPVLPGLDPEGFAEAFGRVARPGDVHDFRPAGPGDGDA